MILFDNVCREKFEIGDEIGDLLEMVLYPFFLLLSTTISCVPS